MSARIKKICVGILVVATIFVCKVQDKVVVEPYLEHIGLQARLENGIYIISLSHPDDKAKYIHFSVARKVIGNKNVSPITLEDPSDLVGCFLEDIILKYGEPHADIGSGFYIPSYITDAAFLVSFRLDDANCVSNVYVEDLLAV